MPDTTATTAATETRRVSLHVIDADGRMTTADGALPVDEARDLVRRAKTIAPGPQQLVLVVPRLGGRPPLVVVRSRADEQATAGLLDTIGGDL